MAASQQVQPHAEYSAGNSMEMSGDYTSASPRTSGAYCGVPIVLSKYPSGRASRQQMV
jgi:hypothetical protein